MRKKEGRGKEDEEHVERQVERGDCERDKSEDYIAHSGKTCMHVFVVIAHVLYILIQVLDTIIAVIDLCSGARRYEVSVVVRAPLTRPTPTRRL